MPNCKHGLDAEYCAICSSAIGQSPLKIKFLKDKQTSEILLELRDYPDRHKKKVLILSRENSIQEINISQVDDAFDELEEKKLIDNLLSIVQEQGFITFPHQPLTIRERTSDGPTHCYKCRRALSFDKGSLMCTQCKNYVCTCGTCLCGYSGGRNYQGNYIPPLPRLSCSTDDRLEYTRIAYAIKANPVYLMMKNKDYNF